MSRVAALVRELGWLKSIAELVIEAFLLLPRLSLLFINKKFVSQAFIFSFVFCNRTFFLLKNFNYLPVGKKPVKEITTGLCVKRTL